MLEQSLGILNVVWWSMASAGLWLLYRIFQLLKAIHFMIHDDFKRKHPEAFGDN